jgi:1,2-diacylglycerol-3-alpha-glucose alpha-1,2-glucosyltransferase
VSTFVQTAQRLSEYQFIWYGHRMNKLLMYDKEMDQAIKNSPPNLQFSGYVEDIQAAYSSGDLFFFPSHEENQGIVLLEAAVAKLPIITRDLPVYQNWLKDEIHCLKGKDLDDFVKLIRQGMEDASLREKLTDNAYQMAQNHRLEKIGDELIRLYKEFI